MLNVCPRIQCRGRTDHSTVRHWTPAYLLEVGYVARAHATGKCGCRMPVLADLASLTWDTLSYFAREGKWKLRYWLLDCGWLRP